MHFFGIGLVSSCCHENVNVMTVEKNRGKSIEK